MKTLSRLGRQGEGSDLKYVAKSSACAEKAKQKNNAEPKMNWVRRHAVPARRNSTIYYIA